MFKGIYIAIVTPFAQGLVDEESFRLLINRLVEKGVHGIVPCGTTGESPTLSHEEHRQVIEITIDEVKGRIPVIAGTGSNSTAEAIALTTHAKKVGADGVLMVTPYYNKPTQEGTYQHFKAVYDAAPIPIILYNIPGRTGSNILPQTIARLAKDGYIAGVKEATGNISQMAETIELCGPEIDVFSGDDGVTLPLMAIGGKGVISVAGQVYPERMVEMYNAFVGGDLAGSRDIFYELLPLFRAMFMETNPIPVKAALGMMGLIDPQLRLPMSSLAPENREKLQKILQSYSLVK